MSDEYDDEFDDLDVMLSKVAENFRSGREYVHGTLGVAYAILVRTHRDQTMRALLKERFKAAGRKDQKNTDDAARIVKLTITEDRQAAHPYTRVLRKALEAKVKVSSFATWVDDNGIYPKKSVVKPTTGNLDEAKRAQEWSDGIDEIGSASAIGRLELPPGIATSNVSLLLIRKRVASDLSAEIIEVLSTEKDELLGRIVRKYGREG